MQGRSATVPTYDYRCEGGHRYERREPFGSPSTHACERCGKLAQRQLSAPPVVFKGSGWYKTESRSKRAAETGSDRSSKSSGDSDGASTSTSTKAKSSKSESSSSSKKSTSSSSNGSSGSD